MAKRFTDTSLYDKAWFQELPNQYKLFWEYITKKCDNAGFWDINLGMFSYIFNGLKLKEEEIIKVFKGKIVKLNDKFFIPKFIEFQNGDTLRDNNNAHKQIIKILDKNGLLDDLGAWKGLPRGLAGASKLPLGESKYSIVYTSSNNKELKEKKINKRKEMFGKKVYLEDNIVDGKW
tara:strand:- start:1381 stop:1908 length:528 start_codon:yes stop_codon:yes gene_type:complete